MPRVPVLMYHRIGPVRRDSIVAGQYVTPKAFAGHLRVLKALGYPILTPDEAFEFRRGALITFDDGYLDFYETAASLLKESGGSGLVFLVSSCVGKTNLWDEAVGDVTERLMDWDQVRAARKMGMFVGSHTVNHARLSSISETEALEEVQASKTQIEAELGEPCPWFCYPYGGMNETVVASVKAAGYRAAFATTKGSFAAHSDPFAIPRINVRADTSSAVLAYKIFRAVALGR